MYTHYYDKLIADRRQQMQADAAKQRMIASLPRRRVSVGRHALCKLGEALVMLGSRLERLEMPRGDREGAFGSQRLI